MKNFLVFSLGIFISIKSNAQIKVGLGGNIVMCKPTNPSNTVIIGNPTPLFCPGKLQIKNNNLPTLVSEAWLSDDWGWCQISRANFKNAKHWIVDYNGGHNFFVTSYGDVYSKNKILKGSDSTFKFNVNTIVNPYQKLMLIRGVTYQFKPHAFCKECVTDTLIDSATTQPVHYGFIAQELERIIPEVVTTLPDSTKAVEYTEIIPLLLEGIKYQGQQIDSLRTLITQLSNSNNITNFQIQIDALQAAVNALIIQMNQMNYNNTVTNFQGQLSAIQSQINQCCSLIMNNTYGNDISTLGNLIADI